MSNGTDKGFGSSRPTINVAGEDNGELAGGLLRLLIVEDTSGLYRCEATFGNLGDKDGSPGCVLALPPLLVDVSDPEVQSGMERIDQARFSDAGWPSQDRRPSAEQVSKGGKARERRYGRGQDLIAGRAKALLADNQGALVQLDFIEDDDGGDAVGLGDHQETIEHP